VVVADSDLSRAASVDAWRIFTVVMGQGNTSVTATRKILTAQASSQLYHPHVDTLVPWMYLVFFFPQLISDSILDT